MGVGRIYVEWGTRRYVETGYYNLFNVSQKNYSNLLKTSEY